MNLPVNYSSLSPVARRVVREEYVRIQGGKCHYCQESLSGNPSELVEITWVDEELFPENFFKYPIHLHHDHETDMTIGAVHCRCNAVLWQHHGE